MSNFGKLNRLNLRDIWKSESSDFTPWLAENIEELGIALGMELELRKREAEVGDFSLDLLASDLGSNRSVVIENQIKPTDHDHLGKLITYASGYKASVVIWVSESIREEHRQALDWLNQITDEDTEFFGVIIEVLQIDDSKPAYNFKPVVFPNEWQKSKRSAAKGQVSEKMDSYRSYFQDLIDELREEHRFTNARKAQPQSWYSFSSGYSGLTYGMSFAMNNRVRVELYIDIGDAEKNKALFDLIYLDKDDIESDFGEKLEWERIDDKRASRIAIYRDGSIDYASSKLIGIKEWSIEHLVNMKKTLSPRLKGYMVSISK